MRARLISLVSIVTAAALLWYVFAARERLSVSVSTSDERDATVLVNVVAYYEKDSVEMATDPVTLVIEPGRHATVRLPPRLPWSFRRVVLTAGHPGYRQVQHYETRNPHWRSRAVRVDLESWAARPGGSVARATPNMTQDAMEHLAWVRDHYVGNVDPIIATAALAENRMLLRSIAFAGRAGDVSATRQLDESLVALESILAEARTRPCPAGYAPPAEGPVVCGQKSVDIVWPR